MKRIFSFFAVGSLLLFTGACNNAASDSVEKADSTNTARVDSSTISTDKQTASFLVDAANGGMMEVRLGKLAQQKGSSQRVKDFGAMMVSDHSAIGDTLQQLAAARHVALPSDISDDNKRALNDLDKKSGHDFDKAYMNEMVNDHQKDIKDFEGAADNVGDSAIKMFINNTLPVLKKHLASADAVQKAVTH